MCDDGSKRISKTRVGQISHEGDFDIALLVVDDIV